MRIRGKLITSCFALSLAWSGLASAGEIVLGNLQDLSGPTSVLGNAVTRGADMSYEAMVPVWTSRPTPARRAARPMRSVVATSFSSAACQLLSVDFARL